MASRISPYVDNTGLVFAYDLANVQRSYLGKPTVNFISNPTEEMARGEFGQYRDLAPTFNSNGLVPHSLSMDIKANKPGGVYVYMQNGSTTRHGFVGASVNATTEYQRFYFENITPTLNDANVAASTLATYTGYGSGVNPTVKNIQLELGTYSTRFVDGTRSVTQGLKDLTGNSTIDLTNVSFDANAQMTFDGTNDLITLADAAHLKFSNGSFTVEQVLNINSISGKQRTFSKGSSGWTRGWHAAARPTQWEFELSDGVSTPGNGFLINTATTVGTNHVVWVIESAATAKLYVNGVQVGSTQTITESVDFATTTSTVGIGAFESGGEYFNGRIPYTRLYARALPASEIQQNFNAIKGRYGL
jgi:hypothetical protein